MKTGKIVIAIDQKVYFEYYELPFPEYICGCPPSSIRANRNAFIEYEASKQLIEVTNENDISKRGGYWIQLLNRFWTEVEDNASCKAGIIDNKATIIELIK